MDAALDGALGHPKPVADLFVGQLEEEPEPDDFAQLGRKTVERREQTGAGLPLFQDSVRAQPRIPRRVFERGVLRDEPLPLTDPRSVVVDAVVACDRVEPNGEVGARIEAVELVKDSNDDLLRQFFGVLITAGKAVGERKEAPVMPADQIGPGRVGVEVSGPQRKDGGDVL